MIHCWRAGSRSSRPKGGTNGTPRRARRHYGRARGAQGGTFPVRADPGEAGVWCARGPSLPCAPLRATAARMRGRRGEGAAGGDSACSGNWGSEGNPYSEGMKGRGESRQRCSECRGWYHAAPSARATQKVCGPECRARRRRRLARDRRSRRVQDARVDERERQRQCRARRKDAGKVTEGARTDTGPPARDGHAPASGDSSGEIMGKVLDLWDRETARSRATLSREIGLILRGSRSLHGTARDTTEAPSRASLGP